MEVMPFASGASCRAKASVARPSDCSRSARFIVGAKPLECRSASLAISQNSKNRQAAWRWRVSTRLGQYPAPSPNPGACLGGKASSPMGQQLPSPHGRSEEHTSELQSLRHLVCRLLLEKKKKKL